MLEDIVFLSVLRIYSGYRYCSSRMGSRSTRLRHLFKRDLPFKIWLEFLFINDINGSRDRHVYNFTNKMVSTRDQLDFLDFPNLFQFAVTQFRDNLEKIFRLHGTLLYRKRTSLIRRSERNIPFSEDFRPTNNTYIEMNVRWKINKYLKIILPESIRRYLRSTDWKFTYVTWEVQSGGITTEDKLSR